MATGFIGSFFRNLQGRRRVIYQGALRTIEWGWRRKKQLALLVVLLCVLFAAINYADTLKSARVLLSLNYEQASEGLNPNETRFNICMLKQEQVMEGAIRYAGLEGKITPEALASCLSISATNGTGKASAYVSTSYAITFRNRGIVKGISAEDMLRLICKAYKDYFMANCAENQSILSFSIAEFGEKEYLLQEDLLRIRANQLAKYTRCRLKKMKNYTDPETGSSFSALQEEIANFIDYDLAKLDAYILENGIAYDKPEMLSILKYKQRQDTAVYEENMAGYTVRNESIELYDTAMGAIVMIPTKDTDNEYYMSRTKTEMDVFAKQADAELQRATYIDGVIRQDAYKVRKLSTQQPSTACYRTADAMILSLMARLDDLASTLKALDTSYLHYKTKEYMTFEVKVQTFKTRIGVTDVVLRTVIVMILLFFGRMLLFLLKDRRMDREDSVE